MFLLKLKGGVELTEAELGCWDNVPANAEIEALAIALGRSGDTPYIIDLREYHEYCCARVANCGVGSSANVLGYAIYGSIDGQVFEAEISALGMRLKSYPRDKCEVPDRCWRKGSA